MVSTSVAATLAALVVSATLPFYLYGAWIVIDAEVVTWDVLVRHLSFVVPGVVLNTIPVVVWMVPRLFIQLRGVNVLHAFLGLQAYALLLFGLTGVVQIFRAKRSHGLYNDPDGERSLSDLHENADSWRTRLRIGVFGYLLFWILAYVVGMYRYLTGYVF
jgi:hypothetical protein